MTQFTNDKISGIINVTNNFLGLVQTFYQTSRIHRFGVVSKVGMGFLLNFYRTLDTLVVFLGCFLELIHVK